MPIQSTTIKTRPAVKNAPAPKARATAATAPQLKIDGRSAKDVQLVKLNKGQTDAALEKLNNGTQGADDVVFKIGDDVYVASGRDLFPGKKTSGKHFTGNEEGLSVELNGKKAEVLAWDNQANNGAECAKWAVFNGFPVPFVIFNVAAKIGLPRAWVIAATAVSFAATIGGAALYGASRKFNLTEQAAQGTVLQENTQAPGGLGNALKRWFGK